MKRLQKTVSHLKDFSFNVLLQTFCSVNYEPLLGGTGRIEQPRHKLFAVRHRISSQHTRYYLCHPGFELSSQGIFVQLHVPSCARCSSVSRGVMIVTSAQVERSDRRTDWIRCGRHAHISCIRLERKSRVIKIIHTKKKKTGTSKVGAISKAQKPHLKYA